MIEGMVSLSEDIVDYFIFVLELVSCHGRHPSPDSRCGLYGRLVISAVNSPFSTVR